MTLQGLFSSGKNIEHFILKVGISGKKTLWKVTYPGSVFVCVFSFFLKSELVTSSGPMLSADRAGQKQRAEHII